MADYSDYQGPVPEWEEFANVTSFQNANWQGRSPVELRSATNAGRLKASQDLLQSLDLVGLVSWCDYSVLTRDQQNIIARVYRPKSVAGQVNPTDRLPVFLYFHGGGYLFGNVESEDATCSRMVAASPVPTMVISVNYRHTPEFRHPTQIHDAWDSFRWLSRNIEDLGGDPQQVVIGGVSAGGGLAASIALRLREQELESPDSWSSLCKVRGQVLCSPWLVHPSANPLSAPPTSSFNQNQNAPVLPWSALNLFAELLGDDAKTDPYFNVALAPDDGLAGMPRAAFLIAGQDLLRDEGLYYAEKLKKNGVPTKTHVFPGLPHGFRRFTKLKSTRLWDELVAEGIHWCLSAERGSQFVVEGGR